VVFDMTGVAKRIVSHERVGRREDCLKGSGG